MIENMPFCYNIKKAKAIVLGADPGNFSDHGKAVEIKVAFGIVSGDPRYFDAILKNLESIGLSLNDVYVQNLITIHPGLETDSNPEWEKLADVYLLDRIQEFKKLDPNIPVLVTAETIFRFLVNEKLPKAELLYSDHRYHPVAPAENKLVRSLYPFFRHHNYSLDQHLEYRDRLKNL